MNKAPFKALLAVLAVSALFAGDAVFAQILPGLNSTVRNVADTTVKAVATTSAAIQESASAVKATAEVKAPIDYVINREVTSTTAAPAATANAEFVSPTPIEPIREVYPATGGAQTQTTAASPVEARNTDASTAATKPAIAPVTTSAPALIQNDALQRVEATANAVKAEAPALVPVSAPTLQSAVSETIKALPIPLPETRPIVAPAPEQPATTPVATTSASANPNASVAPTTDSAVQNATPSVRSDVARAMAQIANTVDEVRKGADESRLKLKAEVDSHIAEILERSGGEPVAVEALQAIRQKLSLEIEEGLRGAAATDPNAAAALVPKIAEGLREAERIVPGAVDEESARKADEAVLRLIADAQGRAEALRMSGGDRLFKDSNGDGVSDYDSVHVFGLDPERPSPVSVYQGRELRAEEKILLGFDPTKEELVKIEYEEPRAVLAPIAPTHVVSEVALADEGRVALRGKALPNSFVTIYVYSTPVIVTVKADESGEWSYVLDRELEDGTHNVYVATVSNSGKIVARSQAFAFTKTAEAATLDESPFANLASNQGPSLLNGRTIAALAIAFVVMAITALVLVGRGSGGSMPSEPPAPPAPTPPAPPAAGV